MISRAWWSSSPPRGAETVAGRYPRRHHAPSPRGWKPLACDAGGGGGPDPRCRPDSHVAPGHVERPCRALRCHGRAGAWLMDTAVLDVDGTLLDSNYHHTVAWARAFEHAGISVPLWRVHRAIGMGGDKLVAAVAGDAAEREHGDEVRDQREREYDEIIDETVLLPGAKELARRTSRASRRRRAGQLEHPQARRARLRAARRRRAGRHRDHVGGRRGVEARSRARRGSPVPAGGRQRLRHRRLRVGRRGRQARRCAGVRRPHRRHQPGRARDEPERSRSTRTPATCSTTSTPGWAESRSGVTARGDRSCHP